MKKENSLVLTTGHSRSGIWPELEPSVVLLARMPCHGVREREHATVYCFKDQGGLPPALDGRISPPLGKEVCLSWLASQLGHRVNGTDRHDRRDRSQPNFAWNSANKIIKKSRSTFAHIDKSR